MILYMIYMICLFVPPGTARLSITQKRHHSYIKFELSPGGRGFNIVYQSKFCISIKVKDNINQS